MYGFINDQSEDSRAHYNGHIESPQFLLSIVWGSYFKHVV
jgi:hypothetical protein